MNVPSPVSLTWILTVWVPCGALTTTVVATVSAMASDPVSQELDASQASPL